MDSTRVEAAALRERSPEQIARRLGEVFGQERVLLAIGERFRITEESARVVALPYSIEELAEMLRFAAQERLSVIPAGAGTWLEMGNRPTRAQLVISTTQMSRVIEYEPADLTATVEAGCTLAQFNARAAAHRQTIPLDPFGDESATLGAIVATASHGPLRCGYGTPRDWVIGMRVAHADGSVTKAGGKVVKNVAGYDLCKLYTGSFGTLGMIGELSFKLRALPPGEQTLLFYAKESSDLCALASRIIDSDAQPAALELFSSRAGEPGSSGGAERFSLALRFINEAETIQAQAAEAMRLGHDFKHAMLSPGEAADFWRNYQSSETASHWGIILRLSVLPTDLATMIAEIERLLPISSLRVHAAQGVIRLHTETQALDGFKKRERPKRIAELRQRAQGRGGQLLILRASEEIKSQLDVWGDVGPTAHLMRALKEKFDPQAQLNPGRFVTGI
jgi:glycolate oxidase FAD binding subunit